MLSTEESRVGESRITQTDTLSRGKTFTETLQSTNTFISCKNTDV